MTQCSPLKMSSSLLLRRLATRNHSHHSVKQISRYSRQCFSTNTSTKEETQKRRRRTLPEDGITISHFLTSQDKSPNLSNSKTAPNNTIDDIGQSPIPISLHGTEEDLKKQIMGQQDLNDATPLKFHLKTYGCQMNVSDSDIVRSILLESNMKETKDEMDADVLFTNTCAIRENAEAKIWHRLQELRGKDRNQPKKNEFGQKQKRIIGVLGCMAERLKEDMFKQGTADLIAGPDAYRDLPRLVSMLLPSSHNYTNQTSSQQQEETEQQERVMNVQLSLDETYADVKPVRTNPDDVSAFVSIMRGCNNMCSYCVVPFTRGRERSRDFHSIVEETRQMVEHDNLKEVILLGQNVNSYHDKKSMSSDTDHNNNIDATQNATTDYQTSNPGFTNMYRLRGGSGYYFADLVAAISDLSPELRVRFTSPHPKDYPPDLLQLMSERHNICNQLHMPAQSGNSAVLKRMRRGYTREAYMQLIQDVWDVIPDVAISSDFIAGFCGETEEEHLDTLSLLEFVKYEQAFMFAYSMRGKTHAYRTMEDDVAQDVKGRRLSEIINVFRNNVQRKNEEVELGRLRVVLVEGEAKKRGMEDQIMWNGRTDQNKRILFPALEEQNGLIWTEDVSKGLFVPNQNIIQNNDNIDHSVVVDQLLSNRELNTSMVPIQAGDYVVVEVTEVKGHTLRGKALCRTTLQQWEELKVMHGTEEQNLSKLYQELYSVNRMRQEQEMNVL